jgi:L-ascorbate metabolism protein UlaG (beta-lactamase superfamily)
MNRKYLGATAMALMIGSIPFAPNAYADDPGDPRLADKSPEAACNSLTLASTGGPTVKDKKTLLIRWMGFTNYELVYGDHVILLDQWYDRAGTQYKDLGFSPSDVTRADLMLVGHAHYDHMADTAQVGNQTHAPIIAAPITVTKLMTQSVNPAQIVRVTGTTGEVLNFPKLGFTVQPILGRHGQPPAFTNAFGAAYKAAAPVPTPGEASALATILARGSSDPLITTEGTIAYVFTFEDGFKLAWRDSGGVMTDFEKQAMAKIGPVDVLLGAVAANVIAESQAKILLPMLETYRPTVYIPGHHEEEVGGKVDRATEPLFQYAKNEFPLMTTISKQFAEPTCFDTQKNLAKGFRPRTGFTGGRPSNGNLNDWNVPGLF